MILDIAVLREGAGSLAPDFQSVTANPVRTLTLKGALRGLPAEGVAPATVAPARGMAFPGKWLAGRKDPAILPKFGISEQARL